MKGALPDIAGVYFGTKLRTGYLKTSAIGICAHSRLLVTKVWLVMAGQWSEFPSFPNTPAQSPAANSYTKEKQHMQF